MPQNISWRFLCCVQISGVQARIENQKSKFVKAKHLNYDSHQQVYGPKRTKQAVWINLLYWNDFYWLEQEKIINCYRFFAINSYDCSTIPRTVQKILSQFLQTPNSNSCIMQKEVTKSYRVTDR